MRLISDDMNQDMKTVVADTYEEAIQKIEKDFPHYKVISEKEFSTFPWFWKKKSKIIFQIMQPKQKSRQEKQETEKILAMLHQQTEQKREDKEQEKQSVMNGLTQKIEEQEKAFLSGTDETVLLSYYHKLLKEELDETFVKRLIIQTKKELQDFEWEEEKKVEKTIAMVMERMIQVTGEIPFDTYKTIALVGPTGVGKTTTLAKIGGMLHSKGKQIGFITTDTFRIGAIEQMKIYAELFDVTMKVAKTPEQLKDAIDYFTTAEVVDHILIDTVGRNPMDIDLVDGIKEYMDIIEPDYTGLVMSCTQKTSDMVQIVENFSHLHVSSVILTKMDETATYGSVFNALVKGKCKVSYMTNGQRVPQDIFVATKDGLVDKILNNKKKEHTKKVNMQA